MIASATRIVLTHAYRTPIGKFLGAFSEMPAVDLGTAVVKGLLDRAKLDPASVDEVIFGCGRQAGSRTNVARQVAYHAGIPVGTPAFTVNKACASSLKSIVLGAQAILLGEREIVIAGGTESMTRLPFYLDDLRFGWRMGHREVQDGMYRDGFFCPLCGELMGKTAENLAEQYGISRQEQDAYAVESQHRCEAAWNAGIFTDEIVPVEAPSGRGETTLVEKDEHPRFGVTLEGMQKLKPVFKKDGTIHAGNSSGITDGAAAVLVMSEARAKALGHEPLAVLEGWVSVGVEPRIMGIGPVPAVRALNEKLGTKVDDYELVELNEAFAAQILACDRELKLDRERLNVNGGAIALGHPIGATGARIVVTLLHEMKRRKVRRGLATLCVSGGLGMAVSFVR